jgi:hypothetical protein
MAEWPFARINQLMGPKKSRKITAAVCSLFLDEAKQYKPSPINNELFNSFKILSARKTNTSPGLDFEKIARMSILPPASFISLTSLAILDELNK